MNLVIISTSGGTADNFKFQNKIKKENKNDDEDENENDFDQNKNKNKNFVPKYYRNEGKQAEPNKDDLDKELDEYMENGGIKAMEM